MLLCTFRLLALARTVASIISAVISMYYDNGAVADTADTKRILLLCITSYYYALTTNHRS